MEDLIDARERGQDLGAQKAVSITDDANFHFEDFKKLNQPFLCE
jgi:hypothetical protein